MRISQIHIRKYRCIKDLVLDVTDYTVLVGPNGSGKSSVLYALDWFFNGGDLSDEDIHCTSEEPAITENGEHPQIDVEVTFSDLTPEDRRVLEKYGRGETARFRKSWAGPDSKPKMIGNSMQGPGFPDVRNMTRVGEFRPAYAALREKFSDLPDLGSTASKDEVQAALAEWESDPANVNKLEEIEGSDATHMFGFDGPNTLSKRMRMVLIPAATDIVGQVGSTGRASAVSRLVGALMTEAVTATRVKWEKEHATDIASLETAIRSSVTASTEQQAERVNALFSDLVPKASIAFEPGVPTWSLKGDASVQTDVIIDGERRDVSRQGHGVQRAVMISMLQAAIPDEAAVKASVSSEELDEEETKKRIEEELGRLPALLVCIEEPEIYQHPVRGRHFAKVLSTWSKKDTSQVILATHSPYFILPEQFSALRCFTLTSGCSQTTSTSVSDVAKAADVDEQRVSRVVAKEIPRTFSEGFFADAVVFVEGDTDRVVLEALAERLDKALDASGITILAMGGKDSLKVPFKILDLVGIPVYVVADADAEAAARKYPSEAEEDKRNAAAESHKKSTEDLQGWLPATSSASQGTLPYNWSDPTVITDSWCLWHDDLEAELEAWPTFATALSGQGVSLRSKKDVAAYRAAVMNAELKDLPESLKQLIDTISGFSHKLALR